MLGGHLGSTRRFARQQRRSVREQLLSVPRARPRRGEQEALAFYFGVGGAQNGAARVP